jgi:hypothetical protein
MGKFYIHKGRFDLSLAALPVSKTGLTRDYRELAGRIRGVMWIAAGVFLA